MGGAIWWYGIAANLPVPALPGRLAADSDVPVCTVRWCCTAGGLIGGAIMMVSLVWPDIGPGVGLTVGVSLPVGGGPAFRVEGRTRGGVGKWRDGDVS